MRNPVKAVFVRHSESTGNAEKLAKGLEDYPLNDKGRKESVALGAKIARYKPTVVLTSPLDRAKYPAERIAKAAGVKMKIEKGLLPWDFGSWSGKPQSEIEPKLKNLAANHPDQKTPKGESFNEFLGKNRTMMRKVQVMIGKGERPAVVTHSRNLRNLGNALLGQAPKDPTTGGPKPSGFTVLRGKSNLVTHAPPSAKGAN